MKTPRILWLTSWYPTEEDPLNGDFIQRHAEAVSQFIPLELFHLQKSYISLNAQYRTITQSLPGGSMAIIRFYPVTTRILWLEKLCSWFIYFREFLRYFRSYVNKNGKPDLIHVHVSFKAGLLALLAKRIWKIPYVVTEHSSEFLPDSPEYRLANRWLRKKLTKKILVNSNGLSVVSETLGRYIQAMYPDISYIVIPNVVNTAQFYPGFPKNDVFTLIHVSNLTRNKNMEDLLEAMKILAREERHDINLVIVGNDSNLDDQLRQQITNAGNIHLAGELLHSDLSLLMRKAHALIMYSKYETFGCVIIEALATGLPVIVSDIPVFHETVRAGVDGYFVPLSSPRLLAENVKWLKEHIGECSQESISMHAARKYGYQVVGKSFFDWYGKIPGKL
jgi:glycosyltransferase involved in cell wall biosynthesis